MWASRFIGALDRAFVKAPRHAAGSAARFAALDRQSGLLPKDFSLSVYLTLTPFLGVPVSLPHFWQVISVQAGSFNLDSIGCEYRQVETAFHSKISRIMVAASPSTMAASPSTPVPDHLLPPRHTNATAFALKWFHLPARLLTAVNFTLSVIRFITRDLRLSLDSVRRLVHHIRSGLIVRLLPVPCKGVYN